MGFFDKFKAQLNTSTNPTMESDDIASSPNNLLPLQMIIDDAFQLNTPGAIVVSGTISAGMVRIGSVVTIGTTAVEVVGVENFNKQQPMTLKEQLADKIDLLTSTDSAPYIYVGMPAAAYGVSGDSVGLKLATRLTADELKGATMTAPALQIQPTTNQP